MTQPFEVVASARFRVVEDRKVVWEDNDEEIAQLLYEIYRKAWDHELRADYNTFSLEAGMSIVHNVSTVRYQGEDVFREGFSMMAWRSNGQAAREDLIKTLQYLQSATDDNCLEAVWLSVCTESLKVLRIEEVEITRSMKHTFREKTVSARHKILGSAFLDENGLCFGKSAPGINARRAITQFSEESKEVEQVLSLRKPPDLSLPFFVFGYNSDNGEWNVLFPVNCRNDISVHVTPSQVCVEIRPPGNCTLTETANTNAEIFQNIGEEHFVRALKTATEICDARNTKDVIQRLRKYWI